jgi:hypothetical protein
LDYNTICIDPVAPNEVRMQAQYDLWHVSRGNKIRVKPTPEP